MQYLPSPTGIGALIFVIFLRVWTLGGVVFALATLVGILILLWLYVVWRRVEDIGNDTSKLKETVLEIQQDIREQRQDPAEEVERRQ